MQGQFKETKALLVKEKEATKRAAEDAPVIHEVQVTDTDLIDKVTAENEKLKVSQFWVVDLFLSFYFSLLYPSANQISLSLILLCQM